MENADLKADSQNEMNKKVAAIVQGVSLLDALEVLSTQMARVLKSMELPPDQLKGFAKVFVFRAIAKAMEESPR